MVIIFKAERAHLIDTWDVDVGRSTTESSVILILEIWTRHTIPPSDSDTCALPLLYSLSGMDFGKYQSLSESNVGRAAFQHSVFVRQPIEIGRALNVFQIWYY
jgi:hypothetical protein